MPHRSPTIVLIHVVWAPHGRRRVLPVEFDETLLGILGHKAREAGCLLIATGCVSDHVHVLLRLAPTSALADVVQRMKGSTARDVNDQALLGTHLRWHAGYWAESVGPADKDPLGKYIRAQRTHHDVAHPVERWQFGGESEPADGGLP